MTSGNTRLRNKLKELTSSYPEIEDIILFGSAVRGKEQPNDIDILILFCDKINKNAEYVIRKELEKHYNNVSVISKTKKTILDEAFDARESILFEGKSMITGENLAERYGFTPFGMFKYSFLGWDKLKKTKFYHALNGRGNNKGTIDHLDCIKLSDSLIIAPLEKIEKLKDFLDSWKINYTYVPTLIPTRLGRRKILESASS